MEEATQLFKQVVKLNSEDKYAEAIPLAERALTILERALGPEHKDVASMLSTLAVLYEKQGNSARAEQLYQRALAIREKVFGPEHTAVATSLNSLAFLSFNKGNYARAESLFQRALAILEKAFGSDHPTLATSLNNLAEVYKAQGNNARAEPLYLRALALDEKALGPDHPSVAIDLNNLANLHKIKGDYAQAEPLYLRALAIFEKAFGPDHTHVASVLNNLAQMYRAQGDNVRAEPFYLRALVIDEKVHGPDHPDVATLLNNLSRVYRERGDYKKAEALARRALAIREKAFGPDHPDVATSLDDLAESLRPQGDYAGAEPLYRRALAIRERRLGPDHPDVALSLNNLATLYYEQRDYAQGEPLYLRALAIYEKALGPDHPHVAILVNNLAYRYMLKGDYARAESLHLRAQAIIERTQGSRHPDAAELLNNLAQLYYMRGDSALAVQALSRGNELLESNLSLILTTGSERQKLAYLATLSGVTAATVLIHTRSAPSNPQALQLVLTTILRRKGRVLDAMTDHLTSVRRRLAGQDRALLDQLSAAQSQLASHVLGGPGRMTAEEHRATVSQFEERIEQLQDAISRRNSEFMLQTQPVTVERVRQALPPGAALVEFLHYLPFDPKARRHDPARYVVYVLGKEGELQWADLGEASGINADITRLLTALRCPQTVDDLKECPAITEVKRLARTLDERVMRPVRKLLGRTRHIFISPDDALNLIPFSTFVDERDRYLIEDYSLTYLTSGRDLLRLQLSADSRQPSLIVADPFFGPPAQAGTVSRSDSDENMQRSADLGQLHFAPLPGTAREARAIGTVLPGSKILMQSAATEAALKQVSAPRVLHIATHGFFLPDQSQAAGGAYDIHFSFDSTPASARIENPLLRSGLALEGANLLRGANGEDGILTALEAAALDLWGTKLVVLSACETGVGEVKTGEGVYGLRRALVLAGSESQMMSLWQVSDEGTRDLMSAYYKRLLAGEGRTEALRQVQLEMLRGGGAVTGGQVRELRVKGTVETADRRHPYYWAAFIQSGDWRSITSRPGSPSR